MDVDANIRDGTEGDVPIDPLSTLIKDELPSRVDIRPVAQTFAAIHLRAEDPHAVEEGVHHGGAVRKAIVAGPVVHTEARDHSGPRLPDVDAAHRITHIGSDKLNLDEIDLVVPSQRREPLIGG